MASSVQQKYQVFLSFRGEDTRLNFTSHLHKDLDRKGIHTFIDNQLIRGEEISLALLTAIEESKISIIVLSKNYASSTWCLDELSKILECKKTNGQKIVPIFYHVDPTDVRNQKGSFEEAFAKHQERFSDRTDKVERWRAALKEVGDLSGYHINGQPSDRCESEHIKNIVQDVSKKLINNSSNDFKHLVGIDSRVEEIESKLCFKLVDVRILGIWGMGGIGKTTIAEAIFYRNSTKFEGCCFLENVRENFKMCGRIRLRDELFCKILEERNLNIGPSIHDRLCHKAVLIVLDDVDNSMQLDLLPEKHYFGPGSRIILTSRDKGVLRRVVDDLYEVEALNHNEALQLFSSYAFKPSDPKEDFLELSKEVIHYAKGVPLALKVLGSALCGMEIFFWKGELRKLKEIPIPEIDDILRISFDGLDHELKNIFLDIACFFKGMDRDYVTNILDSCYISVLSGTSLLIDKSLITISHNKLEMHDLLQQMGQDIVCQKSKERSKLTEPGKRSRLWSPKDIYHVLKNNTGTGRVIGMLLDMSKIEDVHIRPEAFARMCNLRFLKFYYSDFKKERKLYLSQQGLESLPDKLCYLHWDDYPSKSLPSNFCPENLVELNMPNSHVKQLWNGVPNLVKLKGLDLRDSQHLIELPDLSKATDLEIMELAGCTSLVEVPSSIQYLNKLSFLSLQGCQNLRNFPSSIYYLTSLTVLDLNDCSNITKVPEISGNLETLYLNGTGIKELPSSIGCLSKLKYLCLRDCIRLERLPSSICKLKFLVILDICGCLKLEGFPNILETMECLEYLYLSETSIEELPTSMEHLVGLRKLKLDYCEKLKNLPSSIRKLNSLEELSLRNCSNITKCPEIPGNLMTLYLSGTAIEQVSPSIECSKLKFLYLYNCAKLGSLPRFNFKSKFLQVVKVSGLSKLEVIKEHLGTVQVVNICPLDGTAETGTMESDFSWSSTCVDMYVSSNLSFNDLVSLRNSIGNMKSLKVLNVSGSSVFEELPNLEILKYLKDLRLSFCNLFKFPSCLTFIFSLRELDLSGNNFERVPASIKELWKLKRLDLSYCKRLRSLPQLPPNLHHLDAHDCTSLEAVSGALPISSSWFGLKFIFTNCISLNQKAIWAETLWCILKVATEDVEIYHKDKEAIKLYWSSFSICLPGSEIPKWFCCQNLGSSVTIPLPHDHKVVGFALCAVVAFEDYNTDVGFTVTCQCNFKTNVADSKSYDFFIWKKSDSPRFIGSDHVFIGYKNAMYFDLYRGENKYLKEVSFKFSAAGNPLKKCGVCLLPR